MDFILSYKRLIAINSIVILALLFVCTLGVAQDFNYSQFFSSPITLNPAYTGQIEGDWRVVNNMRRQDYYYANSVNSINVSYDRPLHFRDAMLGVGMYYSGDYSLGNTIPMQKLSLSVAGGVHISKQSAIGAGMQIGYVFKSLSHQNFSFPEQYDRNTGGFNNDLYLSENFEHSTSKYIDVNFGLLYYYTASKHELSTGLAGLHINRPEDYFLDIESNIEPRYNWHGTFKYHISNKLDVIPQALYSYQNKTSLSVLGSNVAYNAISTKNNVTLTAGLYLKSNSHYNINSLIVVTGLKYKNWVSYLSFDFNISEKTSQQFYSEALEISLIYERPSSLLKKIAVPWIRY